MEFDYTVQVEYSIIGSQGTVCISVLLVEMKNSHVVQPKIRIFTTSVRTNCLFMISIENQLIHIDL